MHLGLVGGFGSSISVRGMGLGTPAKLKQVGPWKPNERSGSTIFGFRDGIELQICYS